MGGKYLLVAYGNCRQLQQLRHDALIVELLPDGLDAAGVFDVTGKIVFDIARVADVGCCHGCWSL